MMYPGMWHGMHGVQRAMPHMNPKEADFNNADFLIDPIVAWRAWTVKLHPKRGAYLQSVTHHMRWPRRIPTRAHCLNQIRGTTNISVEKHTAPSLRHRCGLHAVKTPEDGVLWTAYGGNLRVMGQVSLWGRVLKYRDGYLAEYAYPTGPLFMADKKEFNFNLDVSFEEMVHLLQEAYGVEVNLGIPQKWVQE